MVCTNLRFSKIEIEKFSYFLKLQLNSGAAGSNIIENAKHIAKSRLPVTSILVDESL